MLTLEILEEITSVTTELSQEWEQLHRAIPEATPFQTPEWLITWWQHFGGGRLQIVTFRDSAGRLSAVIPCFLHDWQGCRQLTLIGSGISDYLDPLILRDLESDVTKRLGAYLKDNREWQVCNWQDLSSSSPLTSLRLNADEDLTIEPDTVCSAIPLLRDFEQYWEDRPSGLRRNVRRYSQKAAELAHLYFDQVDGYSGEYLEALLALHTRRWREQGEPGMVKANQSAGFIRQVSQLMAPKQGVMFFALRFQDQIAAVILAFPHRQQLFAYLSAFDPTYNALGVGRILLYRAIKFASEAGYKSWNFLRGEEPYKTDWGALPVSRMRITIRRPSSFAQ